MGSKDSKFQLWNPQYNPKEVIYEDKDPNFKAPYTDELKEACRLEFDKCMVGKDWWFAPECHDGREECLNKPHFT